MISKITVVQKLRATLVCVSATFLIACGGGSSNSGATTAVAPPAPVFTLYSEGLYSGTLNLTFTGKNILDSDDEPISFSPSVLGSIAGSQQLRIVFLQFSGNAVINTNGAFSLPTSPFDIAVRERSGNILTRCKGDLLFEGTFSNSTSLSGNVTTSSPFICDNSNFGPLMVTGPFEASFGAAKQGLADFEINVYAAGF